METNNSSDPKNQATVQDKPDSPRVTTVTPAQNNDIDAPAASEEPTHITKDNPAEETSNVGQGPAVEDL